MLRALEIHDMLIIDRLALAFQPGLNVLTGETGAGKSILLDSLGFVLGWRGRAELVRQGADQGEVTAEFDLPADHAARAVLAEAGLPVGDTLLLRRVNTREGRKTAWVNDRRVSGEILRALSDTLVELHGQHDDRGLLNPRGHRDMLDTYAGLGPQIDAVRSLWTALGRARKALYAAEARVAEVRQEEDYLRHATAELDALDPQAGEEAALDSARRTMQAAERIRSDVARAGEALGVQGAEGQLSDATRWLGGAADRAEGRLDAPLAAIERALLELDAAQRGVEDALDALTFNPLELEQTEERLFALRGLARKHNVAADELGPFADDLRARLALLDNSEKGLADLQRAEAAALTAFEAAADALSAARSAAATRLDAAMAA
ncbi:MAG: AAA family ATPase, partial [Alphaproteobacteria bacterium]|nr:AAA family ATPase [Alphaproteobacteria bacterium]